MAARPKPTIANYDDQSADQVTQRLRKLSQADLAKLEEYERRDQARSTVLAAIASLRGAEPWPGYDDMEVEEINAALRERDADAARGVLDYERRHKARTTVVEYAERRRETASPSSGRKPRSPRPPTRSRASGSSSAQAPTRTGSKTKSASRSTRRSSGATASGASRQRPSGARGRTSAQPGRRSRTGSGGASKSRTRARSSRPSPPGPVKQTVAGALHTVRGRAEKAAKGSGRAVSKAKGPVLVTGAVAATVGGGLLLGSRALPKGKVLGIPLPSRRSRLSQATRAARNAHKQILGAADRVGTVARQLSDVNDGLQSVTGRARGRAAV